MKRKIVSLLACCILVAAFTACGEASDEETASGWFASVESAVQEGGKESNDSQGEDGNTVKKGEWVTKEMEDLALPDTSLRSVEITEGVNITIGTTPFDYDFAEMEKILRANEFIAQNYDLCMEDREYFKGKLYTEGEFFDCEVWNQLTGGKKDVGADNRWRYEDFWFTVKQDLAEYDNISSITIGFKEIEDFPELQGTLCALLTDILGEEIAEYMVYAYQEDTARGNLNKFIEGNDNVEYGIKREVSYSGSRETWDVEFSIYMNWLGVIEQFEYYHGDYVPMVTNPRYNVSAFTNGGMEDFDINNFSEFGSKYISDCDIGTYSRTDMGTGYYSECIADDGEKKYDFSLIMDPIILEIDSRVQPSIDMTTSVVEKDGAITDIICDFASNNGFTYIFGIYHDLEEEDYLEEMLEIMKTQIAAVVPSVDLSDVTYEAMISDPDKRQIDVDATVTILGVECDCSIHVYNRGDWMVQITNK